MYTPLELEKIEFEKSLGGYKKASVDEFFGVLRTEYEALYKENIVYKDKITMLEDLVSKYKAMEDAMNNALLMARTAGDEAIKNAHEKAADIIKEAEMRAEAIQKDAESRLNEIIRKKHQLESEITVFAAKNISMHEAQIELLKQMKTDANSKDSQNKGVFGAIDEE